MKSPHTKKFIAWQAGQAETGRNGAERYFLFVALREALREATGYLTPAISAEPTPTEPIPAIPAQTGQLALFE